MSLFDRIEQLMAENTALRARVADLEAAESLHWITEVELRQSRARVAELVAALEAAAELAEGAIKLLRQLDMESGRVAAECVLRDARAALARSESATPDHIRDAAKMVSPDKRRDTERLEKVMAALEEAKKRCAEDFDERDPFGRVEDAIDNAMQNG